MPTIAMRSLILRRRVNESRRKGGFSAADTDHDSRSWPTKRQNCSKKRALPLQYRFSAEGTASSEIMDMLGLGSIDKSVLISMVPKNLSDVLMDKLRSELRLHAANSGIAFTIPLNGATNLIFVFSRRAQKRSAGHQRKGREQNVRNKVFARCSDRKPWLPAAM